MADETNLLTDFTVDSTQFDVTWVALIDTDGNGVTIVSQAADGGELALVDGDGLDTDEDTVGIDPADDTLLGKTIVSVQLADDESRLLLTFDDNEQVTFLALDDAGDPAAIGIEVGIGES